MLPACLAVNDHDPKENLMASTQSTADWTKSPGRNPQHANDDFQVGRDVIDYLKEYAREKPEVAALWCFGIGFILGWKLKPW